MTQNFSGVPAPKNRKLNTIAMLAIVALVIGGFLVIIGVGQPEPTITGISFLAASASLWVTWLAIGAVVDAIQARRF